ncbi:MAG: c-type cytochrome [Mariprofundaceae bacterium]
MSRWWGLLTALLLAACATPPAHGGGEAASPGSVLVFEPSHVDFGTVRMGEAVEGWLRIRNSGERMMQIAAVETSCGCTTAEPEERLLPPGGFTRLHVTIDTFAKRGEVRKWVEVIDATGRRSRAVIRLRVLPAEHPAAMTVGRSLFAGDCARCHAEPARGLRHGAAIYRAVCAMCHGEGGKGGYAPRLAGLDAAVIQDIVTEGGGTPAMPAFSAARGGPLDAAQIEALVEWLSGLDAEAAGR